MAPVSLEDGPAPYIDLGRNHISAPEEDLTMPLRRQEPLSKEWDFGLLRLYIEDLEEIVKTLSEVASDIVIEADDFVADSVQDLRELDKSYIDRLVIRCETVRLELTLSKGAARLVVLDPSIPVEGAIARIESMMQQRRRQPTTRLAWFTPYSPGDGALGGAFVALIIIAGAAGLYWVIFSLGVEREIAFLTSLALGISTIAATLALASKKRVRRAMVIPRLETEAPTFWKRNRDQIAINFLFTILGAVIGIIATLALGR